MGLEGASVNWMLGQCKCLNYWKMFGWNWIGLGSDLAASVSAIGIIDEYVDPAEARFDCVEHAVGRNLIADISLYRKREASNLLDLLRQRLG